MMVQHTTYFPADQKYLLHRSGKLTDEQLIFYIRTFPMEDGLLVCQRLRELVAREKSGRSYLSSLERLDQFYMALESDLTASLELAFADRGAWI